MLQVVREAGGWVIETDSGNVRQLEPGAPIQWRFRKDLVAAIAATWGQWVDRKGWIHPREAV